MAKSKKTKGLALQPIADEGEAFDQYQPEAENHAMLLVNTIVLAGVAIWAFRRRRKTDTILAGLLGGGALIWYLASDTVPDWWSNILPFVLVLLVLVFFAQRLRMPARLGQPYRKGET